MSHFNSINQRSLFGKPPAYYKDIGRGPNTMKPPDLNLLTKGDTRNYVLRLTGTKLPWDPNDLALQIPLKQGNTFLPSD